MKLVSVRIEVPDTMPDDDIIGMLENIKSKIPNVEYPDDVIQPAFVRVTDADWEDDEGTSYWQG